MLVLVARQFKAHWSSLLRGLENSLENFSFQRERGGREGVLIDGDGRRYDMAWGGSTQSNIQIL